ncbi:MAG: hypothetical protein ACKOJB_15005, partial [Chthoniobacterales bacterium]
MPDARVNGFFRDSADFLPPHHQRLQPPQRLTTFALLAKSRNVVCASARSKNPDQGKNPERSGSASTRDIERKADTHASPVLYQSQKGSGRLERWIAPSRR